MLFCPTKKHVAPFRERSETPAGGMDKSSFFKQSSTNQPNNLADSSLLKTGIFCEAKFQYFNVFHQKDRPLRVLLEKQGGGRSGKACAAILSESLTGKALSGTSLDRGRPSPAVVFP